MKQLFFIFIFFITIQSYSQLGIECKENKILTKSFYQKENISKNKILFIFNIGNKKIDVEYNGPGADLKVGEKGFLKLYVPSNYSDPKDGVNTGTITVFSKKNEFEKHMIYYGNIMAEGSSIFRKKSGIKGGEIVCFDVLLKNILKVYPDDLNKPDKGIQIDNANDAVLFLEVSPPDLKFEIENNEVIKDKTNFEDAKKGKYKYLIKSNLPKGTFLTIKKEDYIDNNKISISGLTKLSTKFYLIKDEKAIKKDIVSTKIPTKIIHKGPLAELMNSADAGNLDSQYELATKYFNGISILKDTNKALYWYKKSAISGFSKSQEELGAMYFQKNDYKNAFIWYTKASNNGVERAQFILGYLFKKGLGTRKSRRKAKFWWKKSCKIGYKQSCDEIKKMNAFGNALLKSVLEYTPKKY
jgi:hypothetical protein